MVYLLTVCIDLNLCWYFFQLEVHIIFHSLMYSLKLWLWYLILWKLWQRRDSAWNTNSWQRTGSWISFALDITRCSSAQICDVEEIKFLFRQSWNAWKHNLGTFFMTYNICSNTYQQDDFDFCLQLYYNREFSMFTKWKWLVGWSVNIQWHLYHCSVFLPSAISSRLLKLIIISFGTSLKMHDFLLRNKPVKCTRW